MPASPSTVRGRIASVGRRFRPGPDENGLSRPRTAWQRVIAPAALLLCTLTLIPTGVARADNPIVQTIYTADPAPLVYNNRVYLYTGHDEDNSTYYTMKEWRVWSSADMVNWTDHGSPMSVATFSWASQDAWAGQTIYRNGKFYWYVPVKSRSTGAMSIGVGVSTSPTGPFTDAIGRPLVSNGQIDPTVFIDDNGQAYLYWGNPDLWYVKLNSDMISYSGQPTKIELTTAGFGTRTGNSSRPTLFEEGPWVYKRNGLYYNVFAADCCSEHIAYSTAPSPTGPWTYRGAVMPTQGSSFTNHPGIVDYKGNSYFFYHNGALPGGGGFTRSVAVEKFSYNADGTIPLMNMTTSGAPQVGTLDPYTRQEAETIAWESGVETERSSDGGMDVSQIENGDWIKVKGVAFGTGASTWSARVASATNGGTIEARLDSATGTRVAACAVLGTGGWQTWRTVSCPVSGAAGTHDLYLRFTGGSGYLFNLDWWQFSPTGTTPSSTPATPSSTPATPSPSSATPSPSPTGSTGCTASYRTVNSWSGGFQGEVTVTAGSAPVGGWAVGWTATSGQTVTEAWNGTLSSTGSAITVRNTTYNGSLAAGASTTFGFLADGTPPSPALACSST